MLESSFFDPPCNQDPVVYCLLWLEPPKQITARGMHFLTSDYHYTTIFWALLLYHPHPTTFIFWVTFSPAPDCVEVHCWNRICPTPPTTRTRLFIIYCCCTRLNKLHQMECDSTTAPASRSGVVGAEGPTAMAAPWGPGGKICKTRGATILSPCIIFQGL